VWWGTGTNWNIMKQEMASMLMETMKHILRDLHVASTAAAGKLIPHIVVLD
jgi:hypothetical protein